MTTENERALIDRNTNIGVRVAIMKDMIEQNREVDPEIFAMRMIASIDKLEMDKQMSGWEKTERSTQMRSAATKVVVGILVLSAMALGFGAWRSTSGALAEAYADGNKAASAICVERIELARTTEQKATAAAVAESAEISKQLKNCTEEAASIDRAVQKIVSVCQAPKL